MPLFSSAGRFNFPIFVGIKHLNTMNRIVSLVLLLAWAVARTLAAGSSHADSLFAQYFQRAQAFADAYPREKAHLHFDNTSYYVGDTIWFKAYVVTAETNRASLISTPLYVELLDQMGNVIHKQVVRLSSGGGCGQIPLPDHTLSGYYEVRAYTKWMLAFDEPQYFSRTFPVYRRLGSGSESDRSIANYHWDPSLRMRPKESRKKFALRFFPEGGQLVQGIPSIVAFKAEGKEGKKIELTGTVRQGGQEISFSTLHGGMGSFLYTPTAETAEAKVSWEGREYTFRLPEALPEGYVLRVEKRGDKYHINVARNVRTERSAEVAVFISHQGRPLIYRMVRWEGGNSSRIVVPAEAFPEGVIQISLVNERCETICERCCFVMPKTYALQMKAESNAPIYMPYDSIACRISLKDAAGQPIKGTISVAVRDRRASDFMEYDNTLFTDLLLTSELKGYIHQPGYYFAENSFRRLRELDILMLVHGWRKYDMSTEAGMKAFTPRYLPEKELTLHGQVLSTVLKKAQAGLEVSVFARTDSALAAGSTVTDSLGYFQIPVMPFDGVMNAAFQTHKAGKPQNRVCLVKLFRNFRPGLRALALEELNPVWKSPYEMEWLRQQSDSIYRDSVFGAKNHWIDEVIVKARSPHKEIRTLRAEQTIFAFYNMEEMLDEARDRGKEYFSVTDFLRDINPQMEDYVTKNNTFVNGEFDVTWDNDYINAVKYLMFFRGIGVSELFDYDNINRDRSGDSSAEDEGPTDISSTDDEEDDTRGKAGVLEQEKNDLEVVCNIITRDGWNPHSRYDNTRGVRYTTIAGYTRPLAYYTPLYLPGTPQPANDTRRTLYWNPSLETNEDGEAVIHCYNAGNTTFITLSAEAIYDGHPASLNIHSVGFDK